MEGWFDSIVTADIQIEARLEETVFNFVLN